MTTSYIEDIIVWDEQTGTVYRQFNSTDEIAFSPMLNNGTCDLNEGGIVEVWENPEDEQRIKKLLKMKA